jgi:hypothetical protein
MSMNDDWRPPKLSHHAMYLMGFLMRHGGGMRMGPLLRAAGVDPGDLINAINELQERGWITILWRSATTAASRDEPQPFNKVERVVTTHTGRLRYPVTWQY